MRRMVVTCLVFFALAPAVHAEGAKRPLRIEDMFAFRRASDPRISPDGHTVAYVVSSVDLASNRSSSTIWLANLRGDGTSEKPRQLTTTSKKDSHPRWSPDGKQILFASTRSGESQLWVISVDGGEARQLTTIASEASDGLWSPDGKLIAFVSAVYPEYSDKPFAESDALNKKRKEDREKNPVKARVFTHLFYRHWNEWVEDKRQHLFVMPASGGEPRDVTPGDHDANPTSDTFAVGDDFTFTPDGNALVFTTPPAKNEAWSTNYDICRVPVAGGHIECLTAANKAGDGGPRYSPDGKWLAYRAQRRSGFEADRWELMVVEAGGGQPRSITSQFDGSPIDYAWKPDSSGLYFAADDKGSIPLFFASLDGNKVERVEGAQENSNGSLSAAGAGAETTLVFTRASLAAPAEVYALSQGKAHNVSEVNTALLAKLDIPKPESVTVDGAGGTPMQMWIMKPPHFDADKKWPLAFLVHGGPQGAWGDGWSYRWNPALWAAQGYVVALPNPRGSTGFGQKYVDEISGDWGGKCFDDLMAGLAYLEKQPYIDRERMAAAGASFGGYMMDWFEGHTNQFKTLITHCGVYNFDSMYATTDEIWFDEWEHGGPPWAEGKRESYEKFSPHKYVKNFKTPMLIIHNDNDFRVPISEGIQLFNTLQRIGVPSKMINFPDESHWVLKPKNSEYWHREVFAWLEKYAPPGGR